MEEKLVRDEIDKLNAEIVELGRELQALKQREAEIPEVAILRAQQQNISQAIFKKQGVVEWLEALPPGEEEEGEDEGGVSDD